MPEEEKLLEASLAPFDEKAASSEFVVLFSRLKRATGASTDTELARILGIKQGAVSSAKRNLQIPPVWIAKVSKAFSVSADWLFFGEGSMRRGEAPPEPVRREAQPKNGQPEADASALTAQAGEMNALRQENRELRAENRELRQENRELLKENADLRVTVAEMRARAAPERDASKEMPEEEARKSA